MLTRLGFWNLVFGVLLFFYSVLISASGNIPPNSVYLCEQPNFVGHCEQYALQPNNRHLAINYLGPKLEGKVSSVVVGSGVKAWVFDRRHFGGFSIVVDRNLQTLGWSPPAVSSGVEDSLSVPWTSDRETRWSKRCYWRSGKCGWGDRISSLIVYRKGEDPPGVLLTEMGVNTVPYFFPMIEDSSKHQLEYHHLRSMDNRATDIRIAPSLEVELYDQSQLQGKKLNLPGLGAKPSKSWANKLPPYSHRLADYQFERTLSSMTLRTKGWKPSPVHRAPPAPKPPERETGDSGDRTPGGVVPTHRAPPAKQKPPVLIQAEPIPPGQVSPTPRREITPSPSAASTLPAGSFPEAETVLPPQGSGSEPAGPEGWCCRGGRVFPALLRPCEASGGVLFLAPEEAHRHCAEPGRGAGYEERTYGGSPVEATPIPLPGPRGVHGDQAAGEEPLGHQPEGWCCRGGEVFPAPLRACEEQRGAFFPTPENAHHYCAGRGAGQREERKYGDSPVKTTPITLP